MERGGLTLKELTKELGLSGAAFFSLILTLPFLLWIAFPGLSLIFGALLLVNGVRIALKKGVWIPRFLCKRRFSGARLAHTLMIASRWLQGMERVVRPRFEWMQGNLFVRLLTGIAIALSGLFLALPLPPGTNFLPALGVAILALGLLEDDGLFTLIGYALFLLNSVLYVLLPILGITYLVRFL